MRCESGGVRGVGGWGHIVGWLVVLALLLSFGAGAAFADPVAQITEFSAGLNASRSPGGIAAGPDGNLWFTDFGNGSLTSPPAIGRINPSTGRITEFSLGSNVGFPDQIALAADGNLWFTVQNPGAIGRIDPSTGQITEFSTGLNVGSRPDGIAAGPNGNLWFTDVGSTKAIGEINPSTVQIIEFSSGLNAGSVPNGIAAGPDGNLWFTDQGSTPAIGRIDPVTSQITEFSMGLSANSVPEQIAAGTDGNLWFIVRNTSAIGRIRPSTGQITEFSFGLNAGSIPNQIAAGADGNLWFTDSGSTRAIGRIGTGAPAAVATAPVLSGTGQVGTPELCQSASFSTWASVGPSASLFSFDGLRWLRDGVPIAGQTGQTYTPSSQDIGHQLACSMTVTYPPPFLVTAVANSAAITVQPAVSPPPPSPPLPALSDLQVSPRSFSLAGRRLHGRCVEPTNKNKHRPTCMREVTLTIRYTVNTATTITFKITGRLPGRELAGRCVTQTRKNRRQKKCTRPIALRGSITQNAKTGADHLVLARKLAPGNYTLTATAADGPPHHTTFKIVR